MFHTLVAQITGHSTVSDTLKSRRAQMFTVVDGVLYRRNTLYSEYSLLLVIPKHLEKDVLSS